MSFKNIRIKMKSGKSRMQRVKVLASGKYKFVKNIKTSRSSKKSTPKTKSRKSSSRKGGRRMGKGRNIQATAFKWIRIGALAAPAVRRAIQGAGDPAGTINNIISDYTGYNMTEGIWRFDYLATGWTPFVAATLTTVGIPKLVSILRRL